MEINEFECFVAEVKLTLFLFFFSSPDSNYLFSIFPRAQAVGPSEEKWNHLYSGVKCSPAPIFFEQADNHEDSLFLRKTRSKPSICLWSWNNSRHRKTERAPNAQKERVGAPNLLVNSEGFRFENSTNFTMKEKFFLVSSALVDRKVKFENSPKTSKIRRFLPPKIAQFFRSLLWRSRKSMSFLAKDARKTMLFIAWAFDELFLIWFLFLSSASWWQPNFGCCCRGSSLVS